VIAIEIEIKIDIKVERRGDGKKGR